MKITIKLLSVILSAIMILSYFASCGGGEDETTTASSTTTSTSGTSESSTTSSDYNKPEYVEALTYYMETDEKIENLDEILSSFPESDYTIAILEEKENIPKSIVLRKNKSDYQRPFLLIQIYETEQEAKENYQIGVNALTPMFLYNIHIRFSNVLITAYATEPCQELLEKVGVSLPANHMETNGPQVKRYENNVDINKFENYLIDIGYSKNYTRQEQIQFFNRDNFRVVWMLEKNGKQEYNNISWRESYLSNLETGCVIYADNCMILCPNVIAGDILASFEQ